MCGIYAIFGTNAQKKVFEGLKRIEYRGYDSWGIASLEGGGETQVLVGGLAGGLAQVGETARVGGATQAGGTAQTGSKLSLEKQVGKLSNSRKRGFSNADLALGHTRWATHGGVTKKNAHPHLAKNQSFALVQNGVVENYQELKGELLEADYSFLSETDTEVIVGLLEEKMMAKGEKILTAKTCRAIFQRLEGRNTIAVITTDGRLMAIRNGSPLVVGRKTDQFCFSSDVVSMSPDVDEYMFIDSGQMVEFDSRTGGLILMDAKTGKKIPQKFVPVDHKLEVVDKNGFDSFMLKEIHEQTEVFHRVVANKKAQFTQAVEMIKTAQNVFVLGAGSAAFAAGNTAYQLRKAGKIAWQVESYEADSYLKMVEKTGGKSSKNGVNKAADKPKNVCIVFSQSGETADTNEVVEEMKAGGVQIISVVNMPGSTLSRLSDLSFMLDVGPELAVASTKAFEGHVLWGIVVVKLINGSKFETILAEIEEFEHILLAWFFNQDAQKKIRKLAKSLSSQDHLYILGRGRLYYAALESALKLKEISYIHAEGFSGGELKHGMIALIEKGTPVLCLVAQDENKANMLNAIAEVKARGGRIIAVSKENNQLFDDWIEVPDFGEYVFLSSVIPSQLLTCYMAMEKGFDVDKPRNLAKSVTVK